MAAWLARARRIWPPSELRTGHGSRGLRLLPSPHLSQQGQDPYLSVVSRDECWNMFL